MTIKSKITDALSKIEKLSTLENDWDSYDGLAPSKRALSGARYYVHELINENTRHFDVNPMPDGDILLDLSYYGLDFDIEVAVASKSNIFVTYVDIESGKYFYVDDKYPKNLTELEILYEQISDAGVRNEKNR